MFKIMLRMVNAHTHTNIPHSYKSLCRHHPLSSLIVIGKYNSTVPWQQWLWLEAELEITGRMPQYLFNVLNFFLLSIQIYAVQYVHWNTKKYVEMPNGVRILFYADIICDQNIRKTMSIDTELYIYTFFCFCKSLHSSKKSFN